MSKRSKLAPEGERVEEAVIEMSLPEGSRLAPGEGERIEEAVKALEKDNHAPRELSVRVLVHVHKEYPKQLYKGKGAGKSRSVVSAEDEAAATADGFGAFEPEPIEKEA